MNEPFKQRLRRLCSALPAPLRHNELLHTATHTPYRALWRALCAKLGADAADLALFRHLSGDMHVADAKRFRKTATKNRVALNLPRLAAEAESVPDFLAKVRAATGLAGVIGTARNTKTSIEAVGLHAVAPLLGMEPHAPEGCSIGEDTIAVMHETCLRLQTVFGKTFMVRRFSSPSAARVLNHKDAAYAHTSM